MAQYKNRERKQGRFLSVYFDEQLIEGTLAHLIDVLIEDVLDMSVFDQNYKNDATGRRAYNPKTLLKVVLAGYSHGLISSRDIENACCKNTQFMALADGQRPDHSTIAAFVTSMRKQIIPLFRNILLLCDKHNLLGGTLFALDGCKMSSNASLENSGKLETLKNKKEKIERKIESLIEEQIKIDEDVREKIEIRNKKPLERLRKQAARLEKFLEEADPKIGKRGVEVQSNATDNDSVKMHTSKGTMQGYNAQALVDAKTQIIVSAEAIGCGQDHDHLPPLVDEAKKNLVEIGKEENYFEGKKLLADSNYHSSTNIKKCNEENIDAYIPDNQFRSRDPRFASRRKPSKKYSKFSYDNFEYDKEKDQYVCPKNKRLSFYKRVGVRKGNIERIYVSNAEDCKDCRLQEKCFHNKNARRRYLSYHSDESNRNIPKEMVDKVETTEGRRIYHKRIGIVEPVFGNIRSCKGMNRFTLIGKTKVNIQWLLYCMVHNIGKIANYGFA